MRLGTMPLTRPPGDQLALGLEPPRAALPVLDRRARGATFVALDARSALNPPASTGMDFWTINPYVGCEFGCCYCYARAAHRWTSERAGGSPSGSAPPAAAFERDIFVKRNAARIVARSLDPAKLAGRPLLVGTATDPYQPAERRFQITRSVLETLGGFRGLEIWITTKSPLVARDADLLRALAERHRLSVCISLITLDAALLRRLEPRSPLPHARLRALHALAEAGVPAGVMIAPIVPGLTDGWGSLGALMAAAKEAGARFAVGSALRLAPVARDGFLPVLEREFPELVARYRHRYAGRHGAGRDYLAALDRRLRTLQAIHGFSVRSLRYGDREPIDPPRSRDDLLTGTSDQR
jgi:DNA repair photolyase